MNRNLQINKKRSAETGAKNLSRIRRILSPAATLALAALFSLGVAACSDDDNNSGGIMQPAVGEANLRAVHLSPDAPAVDIFLNEGKSAAVSDLVFGEGTGYLAVPEGTYRIDIAPEGASSAEAVLSVPGLELEKDRFYTAVAFDNLSSISALALVDDFDGLAMDNIRVRAVHAAAAVGQVDIWNVTDPANPAPLYVDVDFGVVGGYLDLPSAAYSLGFDVDNDAVPDLIFAIPALPAGTVANVFAVSDNGGAVYLLAQLPDGTLARIDPAPSVAQGVRPATKSGLQSSQGSTNGASGWF
jgi:hypothetical protein